MFVCSLGIPRVLPEGARVDGRSLRVTARLVLDFLSRILGRALTFRIAASHHNAVVHDLRE